VSRFFAAILVDALPPERAAFFIFYFFGGIVNQG
jgi:hypothetical protein